MKLLEATTKTLKEAAVIANESMDIDIIVLNKILDELEKRMSENDFLSFCEEL